MKTWKSYEIIGKTYSDLLEEFLRENKIQYETYTGINYTHFDFYTDKGETLKIFDFLDTVRSGKKI